MAFGKRNLFLLFSISCFYFLGIFLFSKGFLLKRIVIDQQSLCRPDSRSLLGLSLGLTLDRTGSEDGTTNEGCWLPKRYNKSILIIIDALRFDFAFYNASITDNKTLPFHNKMKVFHEILTGSPQNSLLLKFLADPPTTTMQRLKGLTSGSLPTFIDAGENFASSAITEDNFIHQLNDMGKKIVFMGDDTWEGLFPNKFTRSFSFPSFNVKDLHTVDNGIMNHLIHEIKTRDWDVLVAHFLGVDHCGHRYGPNHPEMTSKLKQMDEILRNVIAEMTDDTILFVMGDHGMTRDGDHGGDSHDEVTAALFVYSPRPIRFIRSEEQQNFGSVSQVDLVPTISLLLGIPIPYSNLGAIISELFSVPYPEFSNNLRLSTLPEESQELYRMIVASHITGVQVRQYLHRYSEISNEFPLDEFVKLELLFQDMEQEFIEIRERPDEDIMEKLQEVFQGFERYQSLVKLMCKNIWARFDVPLMLSGIHVILLCLTFSLYLIATKQFENKVLIGHLWYVMIGGVIGATAGLGFHSAPFFSSSIAAMTSIGSAGGITVYWALLGMTSAGQQLRNLFKNIKHSLEKKFCILLLIIIFLAIFSNSYVVSEDDVVGFLLQSATLACFCAGIVPRGPKKLSEGIKKARFEIPRFSILWRLGLLVLVILLNIIIRSGYIFRKCREEKWDCTPSFALKSLSSITQEHVAYRNWRYFISVLCLAMFPVAIRFWMRHYGNFNGYSPAIICASVLIPFTTASICLHWAVQGLPQPVLDTLPIWQQLIFPRSVYILILIIIIILICCPLSIYFVSKNTDICRAPIINPTDEDVVPKIYNHLKLNWKKHLLSQNQQCNQEKPISEKLKNIPLVYGLGTVYSASLACLCITVLLLLSMLLGDSYAPSLVLMLVAVCLFFEVHSFITSWRHKDKDELYAPSCLSVITWFLMSSHYFFSTGHQFTFPTIHWESAFHGFHSDFNNNIVPAILIILNTYSSQIIFTMVLPLMLFWPFFQGTLLHKLRKTGREDEDKNKGEFILHEHEYTFKTSLMSLYLQYLSFYGIRLLGTMGAAAVHRRHLMVWKIFAPRFIFEACTIFVILPVMLLTYSFILRIDWALSNWVNKLQQKNR